MDMRPLPRSWSDLTVEQFQVIGDAMQTEDGDTTITTLDKKIRVLSILTEIDDAKLEQMPIRKVRRMFEQVEFLNHLPEEVTAFPYRIRVGGKWHRVHYKVTDWCGGQYIDLNNYSKLEEGEKPEEIIRRNLHDILGVLIVPTYWWSFGYVARPYVGPKESGRGELMKQELTMATAYPLALFFCRLWSVLIPNLKTYLEEEIMTMTKKERSMLTDLATP